MQSLFNSRSKYKTGNHTHYHVMTTATSFVLPKQNVPNKRSVTHEHHTILFMFISILKLYVVRNITNTRILSPFREWVLMQCLFKAASVKLVMTPKSIPVSRVHVLSTLCTTMLKFGSAICCVWSSRSEKKILYD